VIGTGLAGLTAAFELAKAGLRPLVLEASPHIGGISRTHRWGDNRIDIGGHRFFTKSADVQRLWAEMMDEPMLKVPRLSRIFYRDKFYQYPLQIPNTVGNLGLVESFLTFASYCMRTGISRGRDAWGIFQNKNLNVSVPCRFRNAPVASIDNNENPDGCGIESRDGIQASLEHGAMPVGGDRERCFVSLQGNDS